MVQLKLVGALRILTLHVSAGSNVGHDEGREHRHQVDPAPHPLSWRGPESGVPGGSILRRTAGGHGVDHPGEASLMSLLSCCMLMHKRACQGVPVLELQPPTTMACQRHVLEIIDMATSQQERGCKHTQAA